MESAPIANILGVRFVLLDARWMFPPVTIPEEALRFLSSRDSVRILNACNSPELASFIGTSISEIIHHHGRPFGEFTAQEVRDLGNYPRLQALSITIEEDVDMSL